MFTFLVILIIIISFAIMILKNKNARRYKKVKPLNKMTRHEFKKAINDLEIK